MKIYLSTNKFVVVDSFEWDELVIPKNTLIKLSNGIWCSEFTSRRFIDYYVDMDKVNFSKDSTFSRYLNEAAIIRRDKLLNMLTE